MRTLHGLRLKGPEIYRAPRPGDFSYSIKKAPEGGFLALQRVRRRFGMDSTPDRHTPVGKPFLISDTPALPVGPVHWRFKTLDQFRDGSEARAKREQNPI